MAGSLASGRWPSVFAASSALASIIGVLLLVGAIDPGLTLNGPPEILADTAATATNHLRQPANNSPAILVDPTDDRRLVMASRLDAPQFGCAMHLSSDGGRSWLPTNPVPTLPEGAERCYGPEAAFDRSGTLHFLFVGLHTAGNLPMGAFIATSTDHGRSFGAPRRVLSGFNFAVRMAIDADTDRMHLVWLHANTDPPLGGFPSGPNPVMAAYSDDGAETFSEPVQVSDPTRQRVVAPTLAIADDAVHVAYYDLGEDARDYSGLAGPVWEGTWSIVSSTSLDGGATFGSGVVIDDGVTPVERPALIFTMAPPALAAAGDRACAAWSDARNGDADIIGRCSSSAGRSWESLVRINDDPVGNGVTQYLPKLAMAPNGRIDAVYLDRRHDSANALNDVSYTYSDDDGKTFTPARRLSTQSWSPRVGQRYAGDGAEGLVEIGSRLGLASLNSAAVAAWPDTRFPPLAPRRVAQDIYSARAEFSQHSPTWPKALGATLVVVGLGLGVTAFILHKRRSGVGSPANGEGAEPDDGAEDEPSDKPGQKVLVGTGVAVAIAIVAWAVVSSGSDSNAAAASPPVVEVSLVEYRFDYQAPTQPGRTIFSVANNGAGNHMFSLNLIDDDVPPIDEQLHGSERRPVDSPVELPTSQPGDLQTFAVDLAPGQRYAFLCFFVDPGAREPHALKGMNSEFRTAGVKATPPTTTSTTSSPALPAPT